MVCLRNVADLTKLRVKGKLTATNMRSKAKVEEHMSPFTG